jgi:hypothetical protein
MNVSGGCVIHFATVPPFPPPPVLRGRAGAGAFAERVTRPGAATAVAGILDRVALNCRVGNQRRLFDDSEMSDDGIAEDCCLACIGGRSCRVLRCARMFGAFIDIDSYGVRVIGE